MAGCVEISGGEGGVNDAGKDYGAQTISPAATAAQEEAGQSNGGLKERGGSAGGDDGETSGDDGSGEATAENNEVAAPPQDELYNLEIDFRELSFEDKLEARKTSFPNSPAKSAFFKGDGEAEKVLRGEQTNYGMTDFDWGRQGNRNSLAFRVLNALKMLGYRTGCSSSQRGCLYDFSEENGLGELGGTNAISKQLLEKIDLQMAEVEAEDNALAAAFPASGDFVELGLEGEPSKNHLAALFAKVLGLLPKRLAGGRESFRHYMLRQMPDVGEYVPSIRCNRAKRCAIVFRKYYATLSGNDSGTVFSVNDDEVIAKVALHEYAHFLDGNVYPRDESIASGVINTTEFYSLAYNFSTEFKSPIGWTYYKVREDIGKDEEIFVSQYARGVEKDGLVTAYEDFAESFAMYAMAGNVFRCKAGKHPVLGRKYEWLKKNVFGGEQYSNELATGCDEFHSGFDYYFTQNPAYRKLDFKQVRRV